MEPITIDLIDGYKDPKSGETHRRMIMRRATMKDQFAIMQDSALKDLMENRYRMSDDASPVEQQLAMISVNRFNLILFKQLVVKVGTLDRQEVLSKEILDTLSGRDFSLIRASLASSDDRLVQLRLVLQVIDRVVASNETRNQIKEGLSEALGESVTALLQSEVS